MSLPPHAEISQQLTLARDRWVKIKRMLAYAAFDGWTLIVLGGLTLICGGYGSVMGVVVSIVLLGTGLFEIRCVNRIRRLNEFAIAQMAYNQMVLISALVLYAVVSLIQSRNGSMPTELSDLVAMLGLTNDDVKAEFSTAMTIVYAGLIAFTFLVQGGTAWYYFSRQRYLLEYLQQTPEWIHQMQRERGVISL